MNRTLLSTSLLTLLCAAPLAAQAADIEFTGRWDSRYLSEGVNNLEKGGIFWGEANVSQDGLNGYIKVGRGDSVKYTELNAGLNYTVDLPVDFSTTLGYERVESWADERGHDNNLTAALDYNGIDWLTPEIYYSYATEAKGYYLQFSLTGNFQVNEQFTLNPYVQEVVDFGAITESYNGPNNFELGINANYQLTSHISLGAVVSHSIAQTNLKRDAAPGADMNQTYAGINFTWR
ncbi:hypothetical protein NFHSH190041_02560 [Shewanella sp. NFH-SH190041]|uniref:hypothetical protein n=1 Tax=Shewanella sp. NFH-SH190041 TaxID=2950245 RepID=UPI0021C4A16B|nr:hypothetical protein [Shewanella sp. NFH-SH190041]BDM62804.1 hypothetical protein NFHSH190041_02560 [Shewanella sp. NFH-SH190041]